MRNVSGCCHCLTRMHARTHARTHEHTCTQNTPNPLHTHAHSQVVSLSGWVPDASQPQPKARGSAGVSLKDLVEL